jgi:hypothetical protein
MMEDNYCSKEDCSFPVTNKTHKLCQIHSWERNHKGQDFFKHQQKKKNEYAKRMQEKAVIKAKTTPLKPYVWKAKKKQSPIRPVSEKMAVSLTIYAKKKKVYIKENPECEAHFCNCGTREEELTIHHKLGRVGYATDEKRELEIPLLIDSDYFMAACLTAHRWIEDNVGQAKKWGYSLDRNAIQVEVSQC